MCKRLRIEMDADDKELLEGLVLALKHEGLLREGVDVSRILDALDEARPVSPMPTGGGLALL